MKNHTRFTSDNCTAEQPMALHDGSRRHFMRTAGSAAVATAALGVTACGGGRDSMEQADAAQFLHGVASGDPLSDSVIIWTRATPVQGMDGFTVQYEVATDKQFSAPAASGTLVAEQSKDFTLKADVKGLQPDTTYYYRFMAGKTTSPVGTARTLPVGDVSQVRMAVFSCANYPAGYFNVYAEAARRSDFDVTVHLGDYIYEYGRTATDSKGKTVPAYASANAAELGREVLPATETVALRDYRSRYAQYRTDADLQALHAAAPMIAIWDDHEIANDSYRDGAENHDATEGDWAVRKMAALKAWHEWMPVRTAAENRIYRSFHFGNLLSLHMLDTRIVGRDEQLAYKNYFLPDGGFDGAKFTRDVTADTRHMLGMAQMQWLQGQMAASQATWTVLGQQVLMGRMDIPAPILLNFETGGKQGVTFEQYAALLRLKATSPSALTEQHKAVLAQPSIPYNLDAWDGYFYAREVLLGTAAQLKKNLVVLAGDTHNAWASDLQTHEKKMPVGVEFATSSVSSPGLEEYLPATDSAQLAGGLTQLIAPLKYAETASRGYMKVTLTPGECTSEWILVDTVKAKKYTASVAKKLKVLPGAGNRKLVAA